MKVIVCGGRDFRDKDKLFSTLDFFHARTPITLLIQGGQVTKGPNGERWGADWLAKLWATERGIPIVEEAVTKADWEKFGGAAGPIRNRGMLKHRPERVISFKGGAGTADMLDQARRAGVKCIEVG